MKYYYVGLLLLVFFSSCSKEASDEFLPTGNNPINDTTWSQTPSATAAVNQIPTLLAQPLSSQAFNAATGDSVRLSPTCRVFIPANASLLPNGQVAGGTVQIELLQLRTKGDHVRNARPTTNFNRLLEFAGSFYVKLIKEGQELTLAPNKKLLIEFSEPNTTNNKIVFYGESNVPVSLPPGTNLGFTWLPALDSSKVTPFQRMDSNVLVKGYQFTTSKLQWISCQSFADTSIGQQSRMDVVLPPNFTNNNTSVYAVFKNDKTVVQLNGDRFSKAFFATNLPASKVVQLVSLTKIGEELYLASKEVTVTPNSIQQLKPEKRTKGQVIQFLEQL